MNLNGSSTPVLAENKIVYVPNPDETTFGETTVGASPTTGSTSASSFGTPISTAVGTTGLTWKTPTRVTSGPRCPPWASRPPGPERHLRGNGPGLIDGSLPVLSAVTGVSGLSCPSWR